MNSNLKDHLNMARTVPFRVAALLVFALQACDVDSVLEVTDPDIVNPKDLQSAAGAAAAFAGGIGNFSLAVIGDNGGTEGQILVTGMLADEWFHSGTFPTRLEYELRAINVRNGTLDGVYRNLHRARAAMEDAAALLQQYAPSPASRLGEAFALAGYTYIFFGENYCGGVPFSNLNTGDLGAALSTDAIFNRAIERFDTALTYTTGSTTADVAIRRLATIGKARALVNLDNYAGAAALVSPGSVPTGYAYRTTHSTTTGRQQNGIHVFNWLSERWSVAENEGPLMMNFRSAADPRVDAFQDSPTDVGFDESTPQWNLRKYPTRTSPVPIASGIEARLIEAEATGGAAMVTALNTLRADSANNGGFNLGPLADPGNADGRRDLLFRERAFWLFAQGHRLGDLRRLMRQYSMTEVQVYPTGEHVHKGANYGSDLNLPVPQSEVNNPNYNAAACVTTQP